MEIIKIPIDEIRPDPNNAKEHPKWQVEQIVNSIEQFGNLDPIGVWGDDNIIVEGHGRYMALKELGYTEAECIRLDWLTEEERKAYALAHNKLTMNSDFDLDALKLNLDSISEIDMSQFGFNSDEWSGGSGDVEEPEEAPDDEEEFDDIEKLEKHYGVPYQGNKSRIADIIISLLPAGKRLVDLFGGGGAITHCAILSGKWESYLYNDLNEMITTLFMDAVHGKYHDERRVITREDFKELKDTDPYVKYIWSFGNNGLAYLWGKNIEEIKCQACRALLAETARERRLEYVKFIKMLDDSECKTLNRLQSIEHLQALHQLEAFQRLEVTNIDYRQYKYKEGDVIYCDVPYEQVGKKSCDDYGVQFDSLEFYKWVKEQPCQVFFSSYEISDDSFYKVKVKSVMSLIGANTNGQFVNEYLYSNMPIKKEGDKDGE